MAARGPFRSFRELYFRSPISRWLLDKDGYSEIETSTTDAWPGDPETGRAIVDGNIIASGVLITTTDEAWSDLPPAAVHLEYLHGFSWLRDLRDLGGEAARSTARALVSSWIDQHDQWHPLTWRPDILGSRIALWLGTYEIFCEAAEDSFRVRVHASLARQFRHLARDFNAAPPGIHRLQAINGLVIASVALDDAGSALSQAERALLAEIDNQINPDGGHVSRSPSRHRDALMSLIDTRTALRAAGREPSADLDDAIDRMTSMLRLWRHGDGRLALFNQSTETRPGLLETILARSESRLKTATDATDTGFQRLTGGRTCVIVDTGAPSQVENSAHASPLAFEMSAGKQRLIVNCGTSIGDPRWSGPLRASAAHSMLMIDDHNAVEITGDGQVGGRPITVDVDRQREDGASLVEAKHDGYQSRFGLLHSRRLYLSPSGDDLRGEDKLIYTGDPGALPKVATLRFHLHPRVRASVVQRGASALLRPPSGGVWRMRTDSGLDINESVYFGSDERQRCEQVVITAPLDQVREAGEITVRWALRREEARASVKD
jgi:uncharacterized heparinase superfamily protein